MKYRTHLIYIVILFTCAYCSLSDLPMVDFPEVITGDFKKISPTGVNLNGAVQGLIEGSSVEQHGHLWSTSPSVSLENSLGQTTLGKIGLDTFTSMVNGLTPGTAYFYKAYIIQDGIVFLGAEKTFTLNPLGISMILSSPDIDKDSRTAKIITTYSNLPEELEIQSFGLTWAQHPEPEIGKNDPFVPKQSFTVRGINSFSDTSLITPGGGLNYVRPFIIVGDTIYGDESIFSVKDIWERKADFLGGEVERAVSFTIGNKGYLLASALREDNFWEFDPQAGEINPFTGGRLGKWTKKADFQGEYRGAGQGVGFSMNNKGYFGIGGGKTDFWEYDPTDASLGLDKNGSPLGKWNPKDHFKGGRVDAAIGFTIKVGDVMKGYVGLGFIENCSCRCSNSRCSDCVRDFYEFDPSQPSGSQWSRKADFDFCDGREHSVGFSIAGKGYVIGESSKYWIFDPTDISGGVDADGKLFGKWTEIIHTETNRTSVAGRLSRHLVAFTIGDKAYMGTGRFRVFGGAHTEFWQFDPSQPNGMQWEQLTNFAGGPREQATGFALQDEAGNWKGYIGTGNGVITEEQSILVRNLSDWWEYIPE